MWINNETREVVDDFWRHAGEGESFPRDLERALALALPVALVKLPRLQLASIEGWLMEKGVRFQFGCHSRRIRGCLLAYQGRGVVFLDGTDPADERRFTLAHETGHFLVDYWRPRLIARARLGNGILEVLDHVREPTLTERVHAVLSNARLGLYTQLMERDDLAGKGASTVWSIEDRADRVALCLLAPPEDVILRLPSAGKTYAERRSLAADVLAKEFGLPRWAAVAYGALLLAALGKGPTWVEAMGFG